MYQKINPEIEKKIQNILEGEYEVSVLGTNGKDNFPFLSKIIPMYKNNKLYLLISDLSEHTQNIALNHNVSIYFSLKELNKTKSNNPRLTINGIIKKHVLKKENKKLIYGRMTGWGQSGPRSKQAGHDLNYIGLSGALHYASQAADIPQTIPTVVGDIGGGSLYLIIGIFIAPIILNIEII